MLAKRLAIIAALVLSSVAAQSPAAADSIGDIVSVFDQVCLKRFPTGNSINQFVAQNRLLPVSEEDMRAMLGTDPGVGWYTQSPPGPYTLTIELPPYHTCALRKRFPNLPDVRARFGAAVQAWVKTQRGASMKGHPTQTANVGGIDSRVDIFDVSKPGLKEPEEMIVIVTPVEGGSELRLVRAIGNR